MILIPNPRRKGLTLLFPVSVPFSSDLCENLPKQRMQSWLNNKIVMHFSLFTFHFSFATGLKVGVPPGSTPFSGACVTVKERKDHCANFLFSYCLSLWICFVYRLASALIVGFAIVIAKNHSWYDIMRFTVEIVSNLRNAIVWFLLGYVTVLAGKQTGRGKFMIGFVCVKMEALILY